jgi:hypothetical protein
VVKLFVPYYPEPKHVRRIELDTCIALNTDVMSVHVLAENVDAPKGTQAAWLKLDRRQTYDDLIAWANAEAAPDDVLILANTDIVIPATAVRLIEQHLTPADVFCLSRWDVLPGGGVKHWRCDYSQDVWAFRGPIRSGIRAGWPLGVPGCENKFALQCLEVGYRVTNPSDSIRTYHLHLSGSRTLTNRPRNRLPGPYLWVWPHAIGETLDEYHHIVTKRYDHV